MHDSATFSGLIVCSLFMGANIVNLSLPFGSKIKFTLEELDLEEGEMSKSIKPPLRK